MATHIKDLSHAPLWQQWCLLLLLSGIFLGVLELLHIPAALMLGPMLAGICVGCLNSQLSIPKIPFRAAQTIVGCMVGASISPNVVTVFLNDWWIFLTIILSSIALSSFLGYALARFHIIPGATAVWGITPGAASTMVVMAEDYGADIRMVAFMQYSRVLMTTFAATLVATFFVPDDIVQTTTHQAQWFPSLDPQAFGTTIAIAILGGLITYKLHIPAGYILVPLFTAGILRGLGLIEMQLPEWLLAISYSLIGWRVGLSFDVESLRKAYKVLPYVLGSALLLMVFCAAFSWLLVQTFGIDPLTAFLATSPGGLDTIAIIVASRPYTDMSFVMTLQVSRMVLLNIICPPLAQYLAKYTASRGN